TVDFASSKAVIESDLSKAELIALIEAKGFSAS
ncbi:MAG: heavy-metal-associated domain-containing protein, partial [Aeromonas veronii]